MQQYDLIIAANVFHATKNLQETLAHVRQLLKPGGQLILLESTARRRWVDVTFGLTDGWWRFNDLRQDYPLLSATAWQDLLCTAGFASAIGYEPSPLNLASGQPDDDAIATLGQAVIVAQADAQALPLGRPWLIFADAGGVGDGLAQQLRQRGECPIVIYAHQAYGQIDDVTYQIDADKVEDYQRLLGAVTATNRSGAAGIHGIVHLWSLDAPTLSSTAALDAASKLSCGTTLHLVQALLQQQLEPQGLWLVTQNAQAVVSTDQVEGVIQAALWGMGRVIALEHPELHCIRIDLGTQTIDDQAKLLCAELMAFIPETTGLIEDQMALREHTRHVARLKRFEAQPIATTAYHADATYLITGGLGGIGLAVADWFAQQGAKHLILMGRSQPKAEAQARIAALRALGVTVTIAQADVSDLAQVSHVLEQIDTAYPLRGIVHSVGVLDDGGLLQQTWARFTTVFAPKMWGAWHLHTLTQTMPLDFFILFSSTTGLQGNQGQANHAGANAFLDALAYHRRAHLLPALSINWGAWAEIGAAAAMVEEQQQQMTKRGEGFITPAQGIKVFAALLQQNPIQVGVMPITWSRYIQSEWGAFSFYTKFVESAEQRRMQTEVTVTTQVSIREQITNAPSKERQALLIRHVQQTVAQILGMKGLPTQQAGFTELGMDSLMNIELRRALSKSLQLSLPPTLAFEYPTVETIAAYILQELALDLPEPNEVKDHPINEAAHVEITTHLAAEQGVNLQAEDAMMDELLKLEMMLET